MARRSRERERKNREEIQISKGKGVKAKPMVHMQKLANLTLTAKKNCDKEVEGKGSDWIREDGGKT